MSDGTQVLFKEDECKALYVRCLANIVCVQDVSKMCKFLRNFMVSLLSFHQDG